MPKYTDIEAVNRDLQQLPITANSRPPLADVQGWINDQELELDATLVNLGYLTPIVRATSPASHSIVRNMVTQAVLARVLRSRRHGVGNVDDSGATVSQKYYDDRLKWLNSKTHPFELPDALRTGKEQVKPGGVSFGFQPEATDRPQAEIDAGESERAWMGQVF